MENGDNIQTENNCELKEVEVCFNFIDYHQYHRINYYFFCLILRLNKLLNQKVC